MKNIQKSNSRIALVLGSGGARGLAHIGVIKFLEESGTPIECIAGTSIGAFVGGLYASGIGAAEMEDILKKTDKFTVARVLLPGLSASGIVDNARVKKFIKTLVGEKKIERLPIPFRAIATDLATGEEMVFSKGSLADAILASIAIPALFQPVHHFGRYLVDGALSNPLPVSIVAEMAAACTIAVNVSPRPERIARHIHGKIGKKKNHLENLMPGWLSDVLDAGGSVLPKSILKGTGRRAEQTTSAPSIVRVFLQSISISTNNLISQRLLHVRPDVLISPRVEEFDMLDFYRGTEIVKRGYDAAHKAFPAITDLLSGEGPHRDSPYPSSTSLQSARKIKIRSRS